MLEKVEEDLSLEPELEKFYQTIRSDIEQLENLKNSLNNWDKAYEIAREPKICNLAKTKGGIGKQRQGKGNKR